MSAIVNTFPLLGWVVGAHIVGLDELIQRLIPCGVVEVELISSHGEPLPVSGLINSI